MAAVKALAAHLGVEGRFSMEAVCVDPRWQWKYAKSIWHNTAIRSSLYGLTLPVRLIGHLVKR